MSSTTPPETTESILPSHELRHELSSRLAALATTITADPRMQIPNNLHPTLVKLWDYATRADYILSELDNIEAGGALRFPQQIPDYQAGESVCVLWNGTVWKRDGRMLKQFFEKKKKQRHRTRTRQQNC